MRLDSSSQCQDTIMSLRSLLFAPLVLVGCGPSRVPPAPTIGVRITEPAEGATVTLPFTIRLEATGVRVVPADGQRTPGEGHHHLFFDVDPTQGESVIPKTNEIVHLGSGAAEFKVETLAPGPHRIIAVMANGAHIPLTGVATDTVNVTVAP
jgi:hypothetical protein